MKFISIIVLICFIFTSIPVKGYAATANSYSLRRQAAINNERVEMQIAARVINLSSFLENIGLKDINSIAATVALQIPKNIAIKELSFIVCQDGFWVIGPEQENSPQLFIRLNADEKTDLSVTKTTVPAAEPSRKRQTLLQIVSKLVTEKKTIAEGLTYEQPAYVITPLMERMIFGAKLEKEFLEGFAKQEKKALEEYPELAALINHMKNPASGPFEFIITPELAKKWNLKDGLAKELTKMAPIATAGMRNSQNPLFPGDLSLPMNILLTLLLTNELAEMSVQTAKAQGTVSPEAIVGGEVRYNTPLVNEMLRRRFAELGIIVHSPPRGVYLPIGATSYITTVLNIMFTIYDTASHGVRGLYASKLMGNLKAPLSPFMEAHLKKLGIDLEEYKKSRSEGAQLLIENMMALAEGVTKKIDKILQGENLVIKFSGGDDKNIRFDIENPSAPGNINVIDRYVEYLKRAYVTKKNIEIVRQALADGLQMGFDQARGASYKFFKGVYEGVFGKDAGGKINWTGTIPDSFYGDTGMTDFNQKQPPDEFVKRYVKAVLKGLDANFSSALVGTTFLARISEQDLCRVIKEEPREGKEKDTIAIRFKIFAKEEEGMLKRLGMSYYKLSSGKILGFYRPKISDISEDVSLLEVVAASKLPAFMLSKPVGYVYPTTDPDGDRFVMMQVEKNDPATKARLDHLNVGYLVLSEEKLLVVYVPNQNFLQTQNAYIEQLKDEHKFSQQIKDPDAFTFFAIKTTVSSETWVVLYTSEGVPVVQIPVGFKEIGAIMRKVEFQIMLNKLRKQFGLKPRMVVVHDIFGQAVKLGYNPRLLFAGEESGGMVQGSLELLSTEDNLRSYLSWREKNAVEASVCNTIMICRKFNQAIESALSRGVKKDNVYEDKQFLEDISLSKMLEQLYEQKGMKNTAELRTDIVLVDPLTSSQATKDVRDKMDKEGYYRRDVNSGFFLSLAFGLQDGYITLNDVKAILKEVLLADKEMVKKIISVTDNTAPGILLKQIDDLQRCLFVGDAVYLGFSNGAWEIVRPSGTDTKIKSYPSSADPVVSAVMSNAIGEVYPKIFFELAEGKVAPDMPATSAYVRSLRQKDPVLINVDAIQKRQQEQYQRGLKVDTMPDWFIDLGIQKLLAERFPEYTQDGEKVSSAHVFLGPVSQKEELRYDPESHIIYVSWDFDAGMQAIENKVELLEKTLNKLSFAVNLPKISEKEIKAVLENRNKANKNNFPADILKEDKILFDKIKALKMPIYSEMDQAVYVWDTDGLEKALQEQYNQGKNDAAMISIITIGEDGWPKSRLAKGGSIWNFVYREDRQRQWVDRALKEIPNLSIFAMTQYVPNLPMNRVVLPDKIVENSLPELLWKNDVPLIWVLDAEKSALTLSALRGRKTPFPNEDLQYASISMPVLMTDEQVKSGNFNPDLVLQLEDKQYIAWFYKGVPKGLKQIPNSEYWRYPGLSAFAVAYANINKIKAAERGCIYTNISLPDLIGHVATQNIDKKAKLFIQKKDGKFEIREGNGWDSVKACLNISDACIQMIIEALKEKKGKMVLLGDHGSVDDMSQTGHSFNQVPIFVIDTENEDVKVIKGTGTQADAEVTVAHFLGIKKPANKTGKSLLPEDYVGNKDAIVLTNLLDGFGHTNFDDPMNAFGVAMKEGLMPTIKGLYDKKNYQLLQACGYRAGLRGGRQEDFSKEDIITTRDGMLKRIEEIKPQAIQIILYDYQDIKGAVSEDYDYSSGLYELQNSPFLNDKDFVIVNDSANNKVKVLCLDYPQMGSTEYNTWTIGAMEIVEQSVVLLDKLFISGEIFKTEAAKTFLQNVKKEGEAHFSGILQEAAVHSSVRQLYYKIKYLKENGVKKFVFDLGSDGRDEGKQDCINRIRQLRAALKYFGIEDYVLTIRGRDLCFDRANNMELTDAYINELLYGSRISKREIYRVKPDDKLGGGEKKTNIQAEVDNIISNSNGKIKVGLFDIGGILMNNPRPDVINNFQKAIENKSGKEISKEEIEELIFKGESAQKLRVDLPIEDFVNELNSTLQKKFNQEVKFQLEEFMDILFLNYEPPAGMVELVRNLKDKGLSIYVLSNNFISNNIVNPKKMIKDRLNLYYSKPGGQEVFNDGNLIMSNEIGSAKPNKMAYNKTLEKINSGLKSNLNPENILFFDDQWENVNSAKQLGYNVVGLNEEVSGLLNFLDANTRFFKAIGGEALLPGYLEDILNQYEILHSKVSVPLSDKKLALPIHSSFFRKAGAIDALNAIIKLQPGHQVQVMLGIYGEGADKIRDLFSDEIEIITAKTEDQLQLELKKQRINLRQDVVILKPIGEKINLEAKQVGFSEKTISTVVVAKAMQVLLGANSEGKSYSGVILNRFKEFYANMENQGIISKDTYENSKTQVFDGLDLPDMELAPGINDITKNDAEVISKFIDSFI